MKSLFVLGVLLSAAPLFSQVHTQIPAFTDPQLKEGKLTWFSLEETTADVRKLLGEPAQISDAGEDLVHWRYQIAQEDNHDFSHYLIFRKSTGRLISISRSYEDERTVDAWFPIKETKTFFWTHSGQANYPVRVRTLPGERVLIAMGAAKPGDTTTQIVLIQSSELRNFYPWLDQEIARSSKQ